MKPGMVLLLALLAPVAQAGEWREVGSGEMRWMLFKLYRATLYSEDGSYRPGAAPLALDIRYHRTISSEALLEATDDQWRHLGYAPADRQRWLDALDGIWPSVARGDRLRVEVDAQGVAQYYYNSEPLPATPEPGLGDAFLAIWLDEGSSRPRLREALIGEQP